MIKLALRVALLLVTCGWFFGAWYTGGSVEERVRSMIRDDPSNIVEKVFDPFAEEEAEPLLKDRVWLSMVSYRRSFFGSIARIQLNLRPAPHEEAIEIPLLVRLHHGPVIFPGGFSIGAARVQITLDDDPATRYARPRWAREAKPHEGAFVARGMIAFDGSFQGRSWLQSISVRDSSLSLELNRMRFALSTDAALSEVLMEGDMDGLHIEYAGSILGVDQADISIHANNVLKKERYEGLMSASWNDASLGFRGESRHVSTMSFDTEYRLEKKILDAEVSFTAEGISTEAEEEEGREVLLDYGEAVAAIGAMPIERVLVLWDGLRLWEPQSAALAGGPVDLHEGRRTAERLMQQVSSNVSAYASVKLGVNEQELLVRANAEFMGEGQIEKLEQVETVGQLFDYLLADLTYQADGRLAEIPEVAEALRIGNEMHMLEMDEYGPSGSVRVRAGKVRVNGKAQSPKDFLQEYYSQGLWLSETTQ